jgi:crotonobetainyl-CoA:carnitine CoA-transferase CaiB-like acyl-CoA transferase
MTIDPTDDAAAAGALDGIRIVDLTQMLAGPYCTMMLADQGAEIIKVEPLEGDYARRAGPFRADDTLHAFGGYFASVNRNKKSIALDLKRPEARDVVLRLCADADAVVENYRVGVMDRLGLSFETLRERNPRLVYASIRGFGDPHTGASPYAAWPAFDVVAQAMGGIMGITGPDADTPLKVGPGVGDLVPAMMAAYGIVCAVLRAGRTGRGQYVDVAMVDSILSLCERIVYQRAFLGANPHPEGNRHPLLCPFGMFPARDGNVTIAAHTDDWWAALCRIIGRPELATDPRTATSESRTRHQDLVCGAVEDFTRRHTKQELIGHLGGKVPFGPVYRIDDIVADPHFAAREMIVALDHPGSPERIEVAGIPVRLSETPGRVRHRAPLLGEHTDAILRTLAVPPEEIARWRQGGVTL